MSVKFLLRFFVFGWGRDYIMVFGGSQRVINQAAGVVV